MVDFAFALTPSPRLVQFGGLSDGGTDNEAIAPPTPYPAVCGVHAIGAILPHHRAHVEGLSACLPPVRGGASVGCGGSCTARGAGSLWYGLP